MTITENLTINNEEVLFDADLDNGGEGIPLEKMIEMIENISNNSGCSSVG